MPLLNPSQNPFLFFLPLLLQIIKCTHRTSIIRAMLKEFFIIH